MPPLQGRSPLVFITSFGENLDQAIEDQAKTLLGADLVIDGRMAFSPETIALFDSLGGEQSYEVQFTSMVQFPATGATRLGQIRALRGGFPFYGVLETDPANAVEAFPGRHHPRPGG